MKEPKYTPGQWHHERGLLFKTDGDGNNFTEINVTQIEGSRCPDARAAFGEALSWITPVFDGIRAALEITPDAAQDTGFGDFMIARATAYIRAAYPGYGDYRAHRFANQEDILDDTTASVAADLDSIIDGVGEICEDDVLEHVTRVEFPLGMMFVVASNGKGDSVALLIPTMLLKEPT